MFSVYILYSNSKSKYYVGQTNDILDRLKRHNADESLSTKYGIPWKLIYTIQFDNRSEAVLLESKIKKRGAKDTLKILDFFMRCSVTRSSRPAVAEGRRFSPL